MRVLILGDTRLVSGVASMSLHALRRMGHRVEVFNPQEYPRLLAPVTRTEGSHRLFRRLIRPFYGDRWPFPAQALFRRAREYDPDLVLVFALYEFSPKIIRGLREATRARIVGWFQDAIVNFGRHEFLVAGYDALFFKDPFIIEKLRDYGGLENVHYLPEGFEPSQCHPLELTAEDRRRHSCDLVTYGNFYFYRSLLLRHLTDLDLRVYGFWPPLPADDPLMKRWHGSYISGEEKIRAVLGAKIVVNTSHFAEVRSVNARLFEVAGIGGFQITDAPGTAEFFEPGTEIAIFRGPRQMREMVEHYLGHEDQRRKMAARAHDRAMREHTLDLRLRKLIEVVGLAPRDSPS